MKTSHTFTILFWINKSRTVNDHAELYARVTVNGKRTNIGLKRKVDIHLWDNQSKRAKGKTKEAKELNDYVYLVHARLLNIYQDLKYKGELITAQLVKSIYNGENINSKTLIELLAYHTFATTVTLSNGVPIETVSKMLGHTKLATTQIYARVLDKKLSEDMMDLQLKLNDKKPRKNNGSKNSK